MRLLRSRYGLRLAVARNDGKRGDIDGEKSRPKSNKK